VQENAKTRQKFPDHRQKLAGIFMTEFLGAKIF